MKHHGQVRSMEEHFCLYPSSTTGTYHFMDGPIEAVVFCKDQQYYKGHIYMVWISFLNMIQNLKNW